MINPFSMMDYSKAEDQLGQFLSWLICHNEDAASKVLAAAGIEPKGTSIQAEFRHGGEDGTPDRVFAGVIGGTSESYCLVAEWKLYTFTHGEHQASGYKGYLAKRPEKVKKSILVGPQQVIEKCGWPGATLSLEGLLAAVASSKQAIPGSALASALNEYFIGYAVTAAALDAEFDETGWPMMVQLCRDLKALVREYADDRLDLSNIRYGYESGKPFYGFYAYRGRTCVAWFGFFREPSGRDRHYFKVDVYVAGADASALHAYVASQPSLSSITFRRGPLEAVVRRLAAPAPSRP